MNAGSSDTRYHLDLADLIAEATGQDVDDRVLEHLAGCAHCQLEASRWNLVAEAVHGLTSAVPEVPQPVWPQRTRQLPQVSWRRALLTVGSAAAAFAVLLGVGAVVGVVHVHLSGPSSEATLTAVTGCTRFEQAQGTLEQVNGSDLVIQTANGRTVTVTTTPATFLSMSGALLRDITNGASVMVRGPRSNRTIQAAIVTVGQPFSAVNPPGYVPLQGTVSDVSAAGFTLVTSAGTRVLVTTSASTLVIVPSASPSQLQAGTSIIAVGSAKPDGTLSAQGVAAVSQLTSGAHINEHITVKDCSPSAIIEALGAISAAPASAR